jgi:hypothetical protein
LTVEAPDIAVSPPSFDDTLPPDTVKDTIFCIDDSGQCVLTCTVSVDPVCFWLALADTVIVVAPEQSETVGISFNTAGLSIGTYTTTLVITCNDPDEPLVHIPTALTVEAPGIEEAFLPASLPTAFGLSPNRPNPVRLHTAIHYQLPKTAPVLLVVYDVRGTPVRTLVDETEDAGYRSVRWDGRDDSGDQVSSGVYFYRIQAGDYASSRKMVVLR